ncbi:uncharacterized protein MYCGRDRAFT_97743 [Zymoseptoria tritici IPO323]|uniref:Uncharacterized protein n=1 Tax=Zymoseptoria tritici (strain CBS 115943 / IPO323) TaxID=336722 RepID=F9XR84_ZYMTI|nr:uncharacterized protein MYCGRDRAFT_97743 [Zymoseptoria tritici IPO323]EGP82214.1 hypothetical protein MYCGRDRAFT_97743 [Zymoseptoria tritici IPO323]
MVANGRTCAFSLVYYSYVLQSSDRPDCRALDNPVDPRTLSTIRSIRRLSRQSGRSDDSLDNPVDPTTVNSSFDSPNLNKTSSRKIAHFQITTTTTMQSFMITSAVALIAGSAMALPAPYTEDTYVIKGFTEHKTYTM